jgi:hypothetical protein
VLYQAENTLSTSTTFSAIDITIPSGIYRVGKEAIKLRSNIHYDFGKSTIVVKAAASRKYSVTGKYLNGLEHSVEDIESIYAACGNNLFWESVSLGFTRITGGALIGDHVPALWMQTVPPGWVFSPSTRGTVRSRTCASKGSA